MTIPLDASERPQSRILIEMTPNASGVWCEDVIVEFLRAPRPKPKVVLHGSRWRNVMTGEEGTVDRS